MSVGDGVRVGRGVWVAVEDGSEVAEDVSVGLGIEEGIFVGSNVAVTGDEGGGCVGTEAETAGNSAIVSSTAGEGQNSSLKSA